MDRERTLLAFDEQVRRRGHPDSAADRTERDEHVVRRVPEYDGWSGVEWCHLDEHNADRVIEEQIERFAAGGRGWEWKHYSHDLPRDLPQRLLARGFRAEPPEALMFADIDELVLELAPPAGVEVVAVRHEADVAALVQVHDAVFGGDNSGYGRTLLETLARNPARVAAVLALAGGEPIAGGRVEVHLDSEFASLWGGATLAGWRKRGVYRALVAERAAFAGAQGARYLQVDAADMSRPILERLGFERLGTTTPYRHP